MKMTTVTHPIWQKLLFTPLQIAFSMFVFVCLCEEFLARCSELGLEFRFLDRRKRFESILNTFNQRKMTTSSIQKHC